MNDLTLYRQGDVLLQKIAALPTGLKPAERDEAGRVVLALGEAHGHAHAFRNANVLSFRKETAEGDVANRAMVDYLEITGSGASLKHELIDGTKADHDTIEIEPGAYRVIQQRAYAAPSLEEQEKAKREERAAAQRAYAAYD